MPVGADAIVVMALKFAVTLNGPDITTDVDALPAAVTGPVQFAKAKPVFAPAVTGALVAAL
jgi:hypothetical protein